MLVWTKTNGHNKKTLVNVTNTFCKGFGNGFIGTVIKSPIKEIVGKTLEVDGQCYRSKHLNQYYTPVKKQL